MRLKEFLSLYKILPVILPLLIASQLGLAADPIETKGEKTERILECWGDMTQIRVENGAKLQIGSHGPKSQIFKTVVDFFPVNLRLSELKDNPKSVPQSVSNLQERMVDGTYELSELIAVGMYTSPRIAKSITSLSKKSGFKISRKFFNYFGFTRTRAYAFRAGPYRSYFYDIQLPRNLPKNSKSPELDFANFMTSFADALEKADSGSQGTFRYSTNSVINSLKAYSLFGVESFRSAVFFALPPDGKKGTSTLFLNLAIRLYTKDAERQKMLFQLLQLRKDPSTAFDKALLLDDAELTILNEQGIDALIIQLIQKRGYHEALQFVARAVPTIMFLASIDLFRAAGGGWGFNGQHKPDFCTKNSESDRTAILSDDPRVAIYPPFDPVFIGPPRAPNLIGKPNPCDPDGSIAKKYRELESAGWPTRELPHTMGQWVSENKVRRSPDNGEPIIKGGEMEADTLYDQIRARYRDLSTGCCPYVKWSFENPAPD